MQVEVPSDRWCRSQPYAGRLSPLDFAKSLNALAKTVMTTEQDTKRSKKRISLARHRDGLHDRLEQGDGGTVVALTPNGHRPRPPSVVSVDPYAELKARIHHQCIAKLGPELYKQDSDDLSDRVYRAVNESLHSTALL